jgi:hypothetical protein
MQVSVVQRQTLGGEGSRDVDEPTKVMVGEPKVQSEVVSIQKSPQVAVIYNNSSRIESILIIF